MCDPWDEDAGYYNFFWTLLGTQSIKRLKGEVYSAVLSELEKSSEIQHFLKVIPFF